jgi:predicted Rossmann fold nucleotide-binding protein DprA/Smf involved in DNA uptake
MNQEAAYWIALANLPKWGPKKTIGLIIRFYHEYKLGIEEFFHLPVEKWEEDFGLNTAEIGELNQVKSELPNNAFLAESLYNEGYEIIPVISPEYSQTLKDNLKSQAPVIIYIKGNKQIIHEKSIAIVGSRNASVLALQFTDNIARLAGKEYKVVVSGFAKGVDKQALDSAINYKGQSIIVLPQGIMTFSTGFKKYYKQIVDGDVLVLSTFHPKTPWKVELAMARNPIIYGLAGDIYVAESNDSGGTWYGVLDGLKKGRKIFVRNPQPEEKNANLLLIEKGAIPVDLNGNVLEAYQEYDESKVVTTAGETPADYESRVLELLKHGQYSAKEIIRRLELNISENKLREFLKSHKDIEIISKSPMLFTIKQGQLF